MDEVLTWLMEGDPTIRWQVMKDLLNKSKSDYEKERLKIAKNGWGYKLVQSQTKQQGWNNTTPRNKWTAPHWLITVLRRIGYPPDLENKEIIECLQNFVTHGLKPDGGINLLNTKKNGHVCYTGNILANLIYFNVHDDQITKIIDYIKNTQLIDGGWNCDDRKKHHSSFHSTWSILEAISLAKNSKNNILSTFCDDLAQLESKGQEFLLEHELYKSHRTKQIADERLLKFCFPPHYRYDIMAALDYFQSISYPYDERMTDAVKIIQSKELEGKWKLDQILKGEIFFEMENTGKFSRWNTLRALRILKWSNLN